MVIVLGSGTGGGPTVPWIVRVTGSRNLNDAEIDRRSCHDVGDRWRVHLAVHGHRLRAVVDRRAAVEADPVGLDYAVAVPLLAPAELLSKVTFKVLPLVCCGARAITWPEELMMFPLVAEMLAFKFSEKP